MIGLAGAADLVATALARESRNRRAGELLAAGVPATEIPAQIGQAVEALESVPLLGRTLERAGVRAPVTVALGRLISSELPWPSGSRWCAQRSLRRLVAAAPAAGILAARVAPVIRTIDTMRGRGRDIQNDL